ncbi:hypothetical protein BKI52_36780 [marine bacterium AO1-C]|nr:hypothetical protein BKI52_36780 [marine bacterium AO1-C]
MNTQKTYRFFSLLLAYMAITSTLLANGRVFEVFKSDKAAKIKKISAAKDAPKKQQSIPQDVLVPTSKEQKDKVPEKDTSKETIVQELTLENLVPPLSISLDPALNFIFSIEFPAFEYRIYYHEPPIALLPYFENVFSHFIVINAP